MSTRHTGLVPALVLLAVLVAPLVLAQNGEQPPECSGTPWARWLAA